MSGQALLLRKDGGALHVKETLLLEEAGALVLRSRVAWLILRRLAEEPTYPLALARTLRLHPQSLYYHVRRLRKAGLLKVVRVEGVRGAQARVYAPSSTAFTFSLPGGWREAPSLASAEMNPKLSLFLRGFVEDAALNGLIVVGSPERHGPYHAEGRDGHYAAQLALFLGLYCRPPNEFIVRLDVDVKAEKKEAENLLLIGGPITNLVTATVNPHLPIQFNEQNFSLGLTGPNGTSYRGDRLALVARIPNPFNPPRTVIVLSGVRYIGTKAAVLAITKHADTVFSGYTGQQTWAAVVEGLDLDGDGKIDSVSLVADSGHSG